jgi:integrase/recombinase XerD
MARTLPDILTEDEEKALLATFNRRYPTSERNRLMITMALKTGMRVGDLINLRFEDIERDTGRIHIKQGKGKKDRVIFIGPALLSELIDLADRFDRKPEGLVFTTLPGADIKPSYLRPMIVNQAKKAGIAPAKRVHFHLLRHTYLTRLYSQTKDLRLVQEVAGHANISTTQIYTHISGEDVRTAMLASQGEGPATAEPPIRPAVQAAREELWKALGINSKLDLDSLIHPDEDDDKKTTAALERMNK